MSHVPCPSGARSCGGRRYERARQQADRALLFFLSLFFYLAVLFSLVAKQQLRRAVGPGQGTRQASSRSIARGAPILSFFFFGVPPPPAPFSPILPVLGEGRADSGGCGGDKVVGCANWQKRKKKRSSDTCRLSVLGGSFRRRRRCACDRGALGMLAVTTIISFFFSFAHPCTSFRVLCALCLALAACCLFLFFPFPFSFSSFFFYEKSAPVCVLAHERARARLSRPRTRTDGKIPPGTDLRKNKRKMKNRHPHARPIDEAGNAASLARAMRKKSDSTPPFPVRTMSIFLC